MSITPYYTSKYIKMHTESSNVKQELSNSSDTSSVEGWNIEYKTLVKNKIVT